MATTFTGSGAAANAHGRSGGARLVPEELRIDALVDRWLKRRHEAIFLDENLVEAVTANGLTHGVIGVHHARVEQLDVGSLCPDAAPRREVEVDETRQSGAGHRFVADTCHLESTVLEELNVCLLPGAVGQLETEHQRRLIEKVLFGLGGRVEDVLHADALAVRAEVNLEDALTDPPVGDDVGRIIESLEIGGCTQMSRDGHRADTEG